MLRKIDITIGLILAIPLFIVFISDVIFYYVQMTHKKDIAKSERKEPKVIHGHIVNGKEHKSEDRRKKKL